MLTPRLLICFHGRICLGSGMPSRESTEATALGAERTEPMPLSHQQCPPRTRLVHQGPASALFDCSTSTLVKGKSDLAFVRPASSAQRWERQPRSCRGCALNNQGDLEYAEHARTQRAGAYQNCVKHAWNHVPCCSEFATGGQEMAAEYTKQDCIRPNSEFVLNVQRSGSCKTIKGSFLCKFEPVVVASSHTYQGDGRPMDITL